MPEGTATKRGMFDKFAREHNKTYDDESEEVQRLANYHHNMRFVNMKNRQVKCLTVIPITILLFYSVRLSD